MRIIISPAKKMLVDTDSLPHHTLPQFLPETQRLLNTLQQLDYRKAKTLWQCSDAIAAQQYSALQQANLTHRLTPALYAYSGIQYTYMAPSVFSSTQLDYVNRHLRILSGFYGLLRPFDGVVPYRLEMQARLAVGKHRTLYDFWGSKLAKQLAGECECIVNLASKEYSKAIEPWLPAGKKMVTCTFAELSGEKLVQKGTMCKMARGEMVRFMAEEHITESGQLTQFNRLGYHYSPAHSNQNTLTFIKGDIEHA